MPSSTLSEKSVWHLRFGITPECNFRCCYCNPTGAAEHAELCSTDEIIQIVKAAYNCGVRRVHWTGGEPTIRNDFIDLVAGTKQIGYTQQVVTTNGSLLYRTADEFVAAGLTRAIVSLDTLSPGRYKYLTGADALTETLLTIEASVKRLPVVTKINVATMRSTLPEIGDFIAYAQKINSMSYPGKVAFKLIEFCPSNPAQLLPEGQELFRKEWVSEDQIMDALRQYGTLTELKRQEVEGDNPSTRYYIVGDTGIMFGILAMPSWGYPCGGCHKLRMTPFGHLSVCLQVKETELLKGKSEDEQTAIISRLMARRDQHDLVRPRGNHYRAQLGEMRFGKTAEPVSVDVFDTIREVS